MNRAARDSAIVAALRGGVRTREIAQTYRLSPRRVGQIAAAEGLFVPRGRPRDAALAALGPDLPLYIKARHYFGAAQARTIMGIAP